MLTYVRRALSVLFDTETVVPDTWLHVHHLGSNRPWKASIVRDNGNLLTTCFCFDDAIWTFDLTRFYGAPHVSYAAYFEWPSRWQEGDSANLIYSIVSESTGDDGPLEVVNYCADPYDGAWFREAEMSGKNDYPWDLIRRINELT